MKQTIEIEVPDGKKAVWKDNKVVFEDIKPQLPKTWEEFCEQNRVKKGECYLSSSYTLMLDTKEGKRDSYSDKKILPNRQAAKQHLALMQLHQLRDCYRQGWTPNWKDDTTKYVLKNCYYSIKNVEPMLINGVHRCAFLSFPTFQLAEEFLNNFRDLIEQAGDLI